MITVAIPIKELVPHLNDVRGRINDIKLTYPGLISMVLVETEGTLPEARLSLVARAETPFILNLDADTIIPIEYPQAALKLFQRHSGLGAVAIDYAPHPQGHPAFGASLMPTLLMRRTYDWKSIRESGTCECQYMWRKLAKEGWLIAWLPMHAEHKR